MMNKKFRPLCLTALLVSACADTSVIPLSHNTFMLSTSAAPACGATGAARVASKMAAVETLRRGQQRYIIGGANSQNNVQTIATGPTYANTSMSMNSYGSTSYGHSTTYFGGQSVAMVGTHDTNLLVTTFNPGDAGYSSAVDARQTLGAEWEKLVKNGVRTCS